MSGWWGHLSWEDRELGTGTGTVRREHCGAGGRVGAGAKANVSWRRGLSARGTHLDKCGREQGWRERIQSRDGAGVGAEGRSTGAEGARRGSG